VENVGATLYYPGLSNPSDQSMYREGKTMHEGKIVHTNWVDESFLQTLHIPAVAGRLFSTEFPADTNFRMILNEEATRQLGFSSPDSAVGHEVKTDWRGQNYKWTVIGVVRDFHFQDLHVAIAPYAFQLNSIPEYNYLVAHVKTVDLDAVLNQFRSDWHQLNPGEPFEYSFLDQDFQKNYQSDQRLAALVEYFTIIAIMISCLGLFGLATFSAEQRTKEIGVRKVLGASVGGIVSLLSRDFLKLVAISILIATPLAWWVMNRWLQDFAYRTRLGWEIFVLTGLTALAIAWVTISFQAIRSAIANPARSLRTE
jgi:putative ABC transport system permease protein